MSFAGKPLWEMYDVISDTMPEDNPGSLKPQEYADVISYLLQAQQVSRRAGGAPAHQGRADDDQDGEAVRRQRFKLYATSWVG